MSLFGHLHYLRRAFRCYLWPGLSPLTFWHETPEVNSNFRLDLLGEYYMTFAAKADYTGKLDSAGVPLLDYRGKIGAQYNPIAIAQYGLGNYNLFRRTKDPRRLARFLNMADWLIRHLETNPSGLRVWNHHFDFEYRTPLKAPWYSALAQGHGISVLVRAYVETQDRRYLDAADEAFQSFVKRVEEGGVVFVDSQGRRWIEEYVVTPPTHILNGFIWALWGVYDYYLARRSAAALELFSQCIDTLKENLALYDIGFWSLYELSGTRLRMLASPFYHRLHIVQLRVLHRLTGEIVFLSRADRWERYARSWLNRNRALAQKALFKILYY